MEKLKDVGFRKEKKVVKGEQTEAITVFQQSEQAIAIAGDVLGQFEKIVDNAEARQKITSGSGMAIGAVANMAIDAKLEEDPQKRAELLEKAGISALEIMSGGFAALMAGNRRRRQRKEAENTIDV